MAERMRVPFLRFGAADVDAFFEPCSGTIPPLDVALRAQGATTGRPVVVTVFDEGYGALFASYHAMCRHSGLPHVIALHLGSAAEVSRRDYPKHTVVRSPHLNTHLNAPGVANATSLKNRRAGKFYVIGRIKTFFAAAVARAGYAPFVVELDVVFLRSPLPALTRAFANAPVHNATLATMYCQLNPPVLRINLGLQAFVAPVTPAAVEFLSLVALLAFKQATWDQEELNDTCQFARGGTCVFGPNGTRLPFCKLEICVPSPLLCGGGQLSRPCKQDPRFPYVVSSRAEDALYASAAPSWSPEPRPTRLDSQCSPCAAHTTQAAARCVCAAAGGRSARRPRARCST